VNARICTHPICTRTHTHKHTHMHPNRTRAALVALPGPHCWRANSHRQKHYAHVLRTHMQANKTHMGSARGSAWTTAGCAGGPTHTHTHTHTLSARNVPVITSHNTQHTHTSETRTGSARGSAWTTAGCAGGPTHTHTHTRTHTHYLLAMFQS